MTNHPSDILEDLTLVDPPPTFEWVWWMLAFLVLLIVLVYAFYRWRKSRKSNPAPKIPAHVHALEELRKAEALLKPDMAREYAFRISQIIRGYIEERFGLHAPERTTEEFLSEIHSGQSLHENHRSLLAEFLQQCDLVKFAKYGANSFELKHLHEAAVRFVEETVPQPAPLPPSGANRKERAKT